MYEEWGRRLKALNKRLKEWMEYEKENDGTEVYVDLKDLIAGHVVPAIKLYNRLRRQTFVRSSDYTELDLRTEQAVITYNNLVIDYCAEPNGAQADPNGMSTSLMDMSVLTNVQFQCFNLA